MRTFTPTEIQVQTRNEPSLFLDQPRTSVFDRIALGIAAIALAFVFTQTKPGAIEGTADAVQEINVIESGAVQLAAPAQQEPIATPLEESLEPQATVEAGAWLASLGTTPVLTEEPSCSAGFAVASIAAHAPEPDSKAPTCLTQAPEPEATDLEEFELFALTGHRLAAHTSSARSSDRAQLISGIL